MRNEEGTMKKKSKVLKCLTLFTFTFSLFICMSCSLGTDIEKLRKMAKGGAKPSTPTYTVTFDKNGATGGTVPKKQTVSVGSSITLPGKGNLARTGYAFDGWNTNADGTGTNYPADSRYTPTGDVTLYAGWNTFGAPCTIRFNANGADGTVPAAMNGTVGNSSITLPDADGLTKTGYTFGGWNTNASGDGANFPAGETYPVTGNAILYAKWTANTYTITYGDVGGGTFSGTHGSDHPTAHTYDTVTTLVSPTKTGHTFAGWFTNSSGTGTALTSLAAEDYTANITLYAKWTAHTYTVVYNKNADDATGETANSSHTYDIEKALTAIGYTRTGYIFAGWNTLANGGGVYYANRENVKNLTSREGDVFTLYARWTTFGASCTIIFNDNGATGGTAPAAMIGNAGIDSITLPGADGLTRTGYTFGGWNTNASGNGANFPAGETYPVNGNATLYAKWNPVTYTVVYHKNADDAAGTTANSNHTYDVAGNLNANAFTRTVWAFAGWATSPTGAVEYTDSQSVINLASTAGATVNLYAKWTIAMVRINAGTFTMGSPTNEPGRSDNETQHQVTLTQGFYMGKYQVTQAQYQTVMGTNTSFYHGGTGKEPTAGETQANRPVEMVMWYEAVVFCNRLSMLEGLSPAYSINGSTNPSAWGDVPTDSNATWNAIAIVTGSTGYRLPTEAQWEYACRAGTTTAYNLGNTWSGNWGWYKDNSGDRTHEVGLKQPNAWDLYDMHGNVFEWCWDWGGDNNADYSSSSVEDPTGPTSSVYRRLRGDAITGTSDALRSAYRNGNRPTMRAHIVGLRVIRP
jgi:uncharacterized repeat protein (TIGR02543 family)